jgi:hypothetical protein
VNASANSAQVHGLRALAHAIRLDVEGNLLTVDQRAQAGCFSIAEMWTKTSFAPPSGVMKPKPLVALKNFTVPVWAIWENSFTHVSL